MARRKTMRGLRKGFVQRNEHFWTSVIEDDVAVSTNTLRFTPIVAPTDWVVRAGAAKATLVRIRGHHSGLVYNITTPGAACGSSLSYAIIVVDADDAVNFTPMALASLNENDVLWTRTDQIVQFGDASGGPAPAFSFPLDVKVRRVLRPDDFVYLVTFNDGHSITADGGLRLTTIVRGLIVVK